jgi:hypothetical protein
MRRCRKVVEWGTVASIILAIATLVTVVTGIPKMRAEAVKLAGEASNNSGELALRIAQELRLDVERLKTEAAIKDRQIAELRTDTETLTVKIRIDLDAMEARMEAKDKEIKRLLAGVSVLCTQVVALGQEPMFRPGRRGEGAI